MLETEKSRQYFILTGKTVCQESTRLGPFHKSAWLMYFPWEFTDILHSNKHQKMLKSVTAYHGCDCTPLLNQPGCLTLAGWWWQHHLWETNPCSVVFGIGKNYGAGEFSFVVNMLQNLDKFCQDRYLSKMGESIYFFFLHISMFFLLCFMHDIFLLHKYYFCLVILSGVCRAESKDYCLRVNLLETILYSWKFKRKKEFVYYVTLFQATWMKSDKYS